MRRQDFNNDWVFRAGSMHMPTHGQGLVRLPHDGMVHEHRTPHTANSSNTGFYPGNTYTYTKRFFVPQAWQGKEVLFEFEGIYMQGTVYINGALAAQRPYGYSLFRCNAGGLLNYGRENEIKVVAFTGQEKTSRWYTGGGIYRPVHQYVADTAHVPPDGLRLTTPQAEEAFAEVVADITIQNTGNATRCLTVEVKLLDPAGNQVAAFAAPFTARPGTSGQQRALLMVEHPSLWSCEAPNLYTCEVRLSESGQTVDDASARFGIRTLALDAKRGLRINGREIKLRGTCLHHDNGVLGAAAFAAAERRKVALLKAAGFNCIRSAHNPASPALLDACDELGMLVMDEAFDVWTRPKNDHDYSLYFAEWWQRDLESMVHKDFNHPSVILYSVGNEIPEVGSPEGAVWNRRLADAIRALDDTRYITNGVNGVNVLFDCMDEVMRDVTGHGLEAVATAGDEEGSNALNGWLTYFQGETHARLMLHPLMDARSEEVFAALDIAGMNYMASCYEQNREKYPNRVVLGTETFPADIANLWDLVTRNPYVIGDMTWTGFDYIGEAGCGIFYYDGRQNFNANWPDRLAYIGDIDITGYRRPVSYLREIVYGLRAAPYIAVERVDRSGQPVSLTPWMLPDLVASWTWHGFEGRPASLQVFAASEEVELFLNGHSLGVKPAGKTNGFIAKFDIVYQPGELKAVGRTAGSVDGECLLQTAAQKVHLSVVADKTCLVADGQDLCFVEIGLRDEAGVLNMQAEATIEVRVDGAGALQGLGSADPQAEGLNYFDNLWPTFDGRLLAVVRAGVQPGAITITCTAPGYNEAALCIEAVNER